jgi:hypothetical protein
MATMSSDVTINPRRSQRTARRIPIHVAVKQQGQDVVRTVNTVNFSKHGLRVETRLALRPGQAVYAMPTKANTPSGYCRVVWASEREAGLEFVN